MEDYYKILRIDRSANAHEIRSAYKRLAMLYHPDHNPGNIEAEEMFKKINEAYHILSDALKRAQYDLKNNSAILEAEEYYRELQRKRFYHWQRVQQKRYKLDKEYFKIQGLAFLVFIVISGLCFAIIHTATYFIEQKNLERWRTNSLSLKEVNTLFVAGRFNDAFTLIHNLKEKDPLEFRFSFARDSLVSELRKIAEDKFNHKDFSASAVHYHILKNYEDPVRFETIRRISLCEYYLGNFEESLQALKHLHNQRPGDLELVYLIGIINLEKLNNAAEALQYFTLGKKLFKENLSKVYGAAFEVVMNPADAPDIYFDIFEARARTNLSLENYTEAIKDCNWAIYLRPYKGEPFKLRAQAKVQARQFDGLCTDLHQAKKLGSLETSLMLRKYCN